MRKDIWTNFNHRSGDHSGCPDWCAATKSGDLETANKNILPPWVCQLIKPAFVRLSADDLLDKCLQGGAQNTNESFHSVICACCPKEIFAGRLRLQLVAADATISFNDGQVAGLEMFRQAGLPVGTHQMNFAMTTDLNRVKSSIRETSSKSRTENGRNHSKDHYKNGAF